MIKYNFSAIGIIEISFYTNALSILDEMLKASEVNLIHWEKRLGGRLVSIIIGGDTSAVQSAIDVAKSMRDKVGEGNIKIAITIPSPHPEIIKLICKEEKVAIAKSQPQPIDDKSKVVELKNETTKATTKESKQKTTKINTKEVKKENTNKELPKNKKTKIEEENT